ncbi:acylglycerol kinase, mitochondrial [Prorops nasuta]|uniref:acylglycerol kinase, mitochondrial n=1 Tax=Prorops nasuta TaxID=863751 RepID=UPI0034CF3C9F
MIRIIQIFKSIKNNWKKSLVGSAALSYGVSYGVETYDTRQLMRQYCESVLKYGDTPLPTNIKPRHVTVILNPTASKRKTKKFFEEYCEPLLHLAGIAVTIIQTESEGHARTIATNLNTPTDAIIVAGGDGTLSEVITGLMRKYEGNVDSVKKCPIGVLPLGKTSRIAKSLFSGYNDMIAIREMVDATMAVIIGNSKLLDVVKVEPLQQDADKPLKPVYGLGVLEWGAWRDADARCNTYWYWGSLRRYASYVFNGYKKDLSWNCKATLKYTDPCSGCSRCFYKYSTNVESNKLSQRWWHAFLPRRKPNISQIDYSKIINENCGSVHELPLSATELQILTGNINSNSEMDKPALQVQLGPEKIDYLNFVSEGWRRIRGEKKLVGQTLEVNDLELHFETNDNMDKTKMFSIDSEEYDLMPLKIQLLPQSVQIFCP